MKRATRGRPVGIAVARAVQKARKRRVVEDFHRAVDLRLGRVDDLARRSAGVLRRRAGDWMRVGVGEAAVRSVMRVVELLGTVAPLNSGLQKTRTAAS